MHTYISNSIFTIFKLPLQSHWTTVKINILLNIRRKEKVTSHLRYLTMPHPCCLSKMRGWLSDSSSGKFTLHKEKSFPVIRQASCTHHALSARPSTYHPATVMHLLREHRATGTEGLLLPKLTEGCCHFYRYCNGHKGMVALCNAHIGTLRVHQYLKPATYTDV